jgi:hypothetical protein
MDARDEWIILCQSLLSLMSCKLDDMTPRCEDAVGFKNGCWRVLVGIKQVIGKRTERRVE